MTIYERALEFIADGDVVGLGSGRASTAFVKLLGARVQAGLRVRGVPTSQATEELANTLGIPLVSLEQGMPLAVTVDGADEVDPQLNLIKGYGRAMVREKIVAAVSRKLVILVGQDKLVSALGEHGKLPVEVVPLALPLAQQRLRELGCEPIPWEKDGTLALTDNGNYILDCKVARIEQPEELELKIRAIPGVLGTGLFLGMADVVLVGDKEDFHFLDMRQRKAS